MLGVRQRRRLAAGVLFGAVCIASLVLSTPLMLVELTQTQFAMPTAKGWWLIALGGLGGSFAAQLCFLHAIDTLGPQRACLLMNLIPMFGVVLSSLFLGEAVTAWHALSLGLILAGIVAVERGSRSLSTA